MLARSLGAVWAESPKHAWHVCTFQHAGRRARWMRSERESIDHDATSKKVMNSYEKTLEVS